jgi:K+-transporting ATPase ATPase C chain
MNTEILIALRTTLVTLVLTGLIYPIAITGVAQALFSHKAGGSLLKDSKGNVIGSELLGQVTSNPAYLQPRPSAAGTGYDGAASSGSNLGPTSQKLRDRVTADIERLKKENPDAPEIIPADLVTASGSGLDPHLSPEGALWQADRIAKARGVEVERVRQVIRGMIEGRELGVFGEPRVNVLKTNLKLDDRFADQPAAGQP